MLQEYQTTMKHHNEFDEKRRQQARDWMWSMLHDKLQELFIHDKNVQPLLPQVEQAVLDGITTPSAACNRLLERFRRH